MELKGLCLRTVDYKDKDKLLIVATLQEGIITIKATGVRSAKAKLKAGCMPLVFGDFSVIKGKGGYILKGISIEENFQSCWTDATKNLACMLIMEFLERSAIKGQEITFEIVLALKALNTINYGQVYPFAIVCWYLLRALKYIGVDVAVEEMPVSIRKHMLSLLHIDLEDIEGLELYQNDISNVLMYLNLIINSKLSIGLRLYKEAKRFLK